MKIAGDASVTGIGICVDARPSNSTEIATLVNPSNPYGTTALTCPELDTIIAPGVPSNNTRVPPSRLDTNPRASNCAVTAAAGPKLLP